jgi:hypothetical protein
MTTKYNPKGTNKPLTKPKPPNIAAEFKRVTGIKLNSTPKPKPVKP